MIERKALNRLVVATLRENDEGMRAIEIYDTIRFERPEVLRTERVSGFRGFVKVINSFEQVKSLGTGVKIYVLQKKV